VGRNALPASVAKLLVENLAPGTFARLGFDYLRLSEINPRLSFAQVKGCASDSPHANYLAFDMIAQGDGPHDGRHRLSRRSPHPAGHVGRRHRRRHAVRHGNSRRPLSAHDDRSRQHIQIAMRDAMLGARLPHRMRTSPAAFGYHGRTRNQLENLDHGRGDAGGLQSWSE
jgi:hypothetical protein